MFKVGDSVILLPTSEWIDSETNPHWGGKYGKVIGKIIEIDTEYDHELPIRVLWGKDNTNSYYAKDLRLASKYTNVFDDGLFTI